MLNFLLKRFIGAVILIIFISFIAFGIMKLDFTIPAFDWNWTLGNTKLINIHSPATPIATGDPLADLKLNPAISEAKIQAEYKRLGLDKSFSEQYFIWLSNIIRGNFGLSQNNQPVIEMIKPALLNTFILNILALFFTWAIAIPLGVVAAVNRGSRLDFAMQFLTSISMSVPSFVLAIFMLFLALNTGLFPIGGLTSSFFDELNIFEKFLDLMGHLFLPVLILVILGLASIQRQMRGNLLDVLREDYIRSARAKGLPEDKVIYKHALRNAINPLITILGYEFSNLFAGSALIEMVLSYPGLGYLTLEAARKLDTNLVLANLLIGSIMLVLGNLIADILLSKLDPRVRN